MRNNSPDFDGEAFDDTWRGMLDANALAQTSEQLRKTGFDAFKLTSDF